MKGWWIAACACALSTVSAYSEALERPIDNTARASYPNPADPSSMVSEQSNIVETVMIAPAPRVIVFADPAFTIEDTVTLDSVPFYIEVDAPGCQIDTTIEDTLTITVMSIESDDIETYTLTETGLNTSIYRLTQGISAAKPAHPEIDLFDAQLDLFGEDLLGIQAETCGGLAEDWLLVDPVGVVFDSVTNEPLPGVTVRLIDVLGQGNGGYPGELALVFEADEVTPAPATTITGPAGQFRFPFVRPSRYRIEVVPPETHTFPSVTPPQSLPDDRDIDTGSYGGDLVNPGPENGGITSDVPVDPTGTVTPTVVGTVLLEKRAAQAHAEITDSVEYAIDVRNTDDTALTHLYIEDTLPPGFQYVRGSARLDGQPLSDPQAAPGRRYTFDVPNMPQLEARTLTYRVVIGPATPQGEAINSAKVVGATPIQAISNVTSATITVLGGVFDGRGYVLGTVFADCSRDGLKQAEEPGIPDVRLYLEDGSFVNTDEGGKYSFYGVIPRSHVLKVDRLSVPSGSEAPGTRFVHLQRGEMHRADFALPGCSDELRARIDERRAAVAALGQELDLSVKTELKADGSTATGDLRGLPASGVVGEPRKAALDVPSPIKPTGLTLDGQRPLQPGALAITNLHDGDEVAQQQVTVLAQGPEQGELELSVNGAVVDAKHLGTRTKDAANNVQTAEFVGVALKMGENLLTLVHRDSFGNERGKTDVHIAAAGAAEPLAIRGPEEATPADGQHTVQSQVEVQNANGRAVGARTPITLESTLGEWETKDLDSYEPGVQAFVDTINNTFVLRAPREAGTATVRVTSGKAESSTEVHFVPPLRPLVAGGIVEGLVALKSLSGDAVHAANRDDGFESELRAWSGSDGDASYGARAALFLKGKVRGDYLLTLGFDSDKEKNEALFRDIQPDQYYPVYGDSSARGYDAQSTGKLYVRVDRNESWFVGGDITTSTPNQARNLGAYNRSLTGIREHFESGALAVDAFASHDDLRQVIEEIPANGTSGPFFLSQGSAIQNSEKIEIVTRDRDQLALVLTAEPRQRFTDYEIEPFTGRLLFRAPIPSADADLNPISIRITYEIEQGVESFLTAGLESRLKLTPSWEVGAAVVDNRDPTDPLLLASANTTINFGPKTKLVAELAHSDRDDDDKGYGSRVELLHEAARLQLRAYAGRTDEDFDNPASLLAAARTEAGAKAGFSVNERTRLVGEAIHTASVLEDGSRDGVLLGVERNFANNLKAELGMRRVSDDSQGNPSITTTTARTKISSPVPKFSAATIFGEYEQDVSDADKRIAAVGGDYRLANRSKIYLRHELISSLSGPYELDATQRHNTTVFGIDTTYLADSHLFSEYRVAEGISGREAQAALGLRNGWTVAPGVRLNTSVERLEALRGIQEDTTALTGAIELTRSKRWKGTGRLELRDSDSSQGLLSTLGLAYKLTNDWTFLGKNVLAVTDNEGTQPDRRQDRAQIGFAYRDSARNRVNSIARYEFKQETGLDASVERKAHIVSIHADFQRTIRTVWRAQYAGKIVSEDATTIRVSSSAHLITGRVTRTIGKRWDAGLAVRALFDGDFAGYEGGVGAEGGYLVGDSLWLSAGYNLLGFRDDDLAGNDYTTQGPYLRVRFKFDESLLDKL